MLDSTSTPEWQLELLVVWLSCLMKPISRSNSQLKISPQSSSFKRFSLHWSAQIDRKHRLAFSKFLIRWKLTCPLFDTPRNLEEKDLPSKNSALAMEDRTLNAVWWTIWNPLRQSRVFKRTTHENPLCSMPIPRHSPLALLRPITIEIPSTLSFLR